MKKNLIVALSFAAALSSQICLAYSSPVSTENLQEMVQTLQKDHKVNLLTKTIDGSKRVIVLHAKETQHQIDSKISKLRSAASFFAGLVPLSMSVTTIYSSYLGAGAVITNPSRWTLNDSFFLGMFTTASVSLVYSGIQLLKYAMEPYFGDKYAFRWFNHQTSATGDPSLKLARSIDNDLLESVKESSSIGNLEFIDLDQIEPVLSILTSSSFGYTLETVDQI